MAWHLWRSLCRPSTKQKGDEENTHTHKKLAVSLTWGTAGRGSGAFGISKCFSYTTPVHHFWTLAEVLTPTTLLQLPSSPAQLSGCPDPFPLREQNYKSIGSLQKTLCQFLPRGNCGNWRTGKSVICFLKKYCETQACCPTRQTCPTTNVS